MECPASLLPDHDGDDHDVPHQPAHHAEDVHTQVQSQLWHCGPWICHGLRGVISNWNNAQLKTGQHSVFKHFSSQVLQILNGQKLIRTLSHSASLFTITRFLKTLKVFVSNAIILGLPYQLAWGNLLLPNMQSRKIPCTYLALCGDSCRWRGCGRGSMRVGRGRSPPTRARGSWSLSWSTRTISHM